ncbi:hypothetical protein IBA8401_07920 [Pseudomonas syringae]
MQAAARVTAFAHSAGDRLFVSHGLCGELLRSAVCELILRKIECDTAIVTGGSACPRRSFFYFMRRRP